MIISRYLTREIINTLLMVTIVLMLAFLSQQVVRYLNYVAIGKIAVNVLLQLVSFEIPYLFSLLLPLGLYLGILLSFGRLYADSEMAMMHMYGYGDRRILRLILTLAVLTAACVSILSLWINPWISAKREKIMASDEAAIHLVETMIPGRFQVSGDGHHVMYIEKLSRDRKKAKNLFLAQERFDKQDKTKDKQWVIVHAAEGYQEKDKDSDDQFFVTQHGYRYEGSPDERNYHIIQYEQYALRIPQKKVQAQNHDTEALPLKKLWSQYHLPKFAAELQWRISLGLSSIFLALFAIPLSALQPRQARYTALIPAVLIYIVYIDLLFIARRWVVLEKVSINFGMWWVHGVILLGSLLAFLLSNKPKILRRRR